jgi:hypothetical protein
VSSCTPPPSSGSVRLAHSGSVLTREAPTPVALPPPPPLPSRPGQGHSSSAGRTGKDNPCRRTSSISGQPLRQCCHELRVAHQCQWRPADRLSAAPAAGSSLFTAAALLLRSSPTAFTTGCTCIYCVPVPLGLLRSACVAALQRPTKIPVSEHQPVAAPPPSPQVSQHTGAEPQAHAANCRPRSLASPSAGCGRVILCAARATS